VVSFIRSPLPKHKTRVMTIFEPTGTGKTTLVQNIPRLYEDIYLISVPAVAIHSLLVTMDPKRAWSCIFNKVARSINRLKTEKSIDFFLLGDIDYDEHSLNGLGMNVKTTLGDDAYLVIWIDECQDLIEQDIIQALHLLAPRCDNVKLILTGTTAVGNERIRGISDFDSVACKPLHSCTEQKVRTILNKVLLWDELEITDNEGVDVRRKIEAELQGTPKNILYFLKELFKVDPPLGKTVSKQQLLDVLDSAYKRGLWSQNPNSNLDNDNMFERIVLLFSFPSDFGFEWKGGYLVSEKLNNIFDLLLPFNNSGLVRINASNKNTYQLSIPDYFTIRYIIVINS